MLPLPVCSYCLHEKGAIYSRSGKAPASHTAHGVGFRAASRMLKICSANFYNLLTFSAASAAFSMRVSHVEGFPALLQTT